MYQRFHLVFLTSIFFTSCGQKHFNSLSSTHDIGLRNTKDNSTVVLYLVDGKVFVKSCQPPVSKPNRNCKADDQAVSEKELNDFLKDLGVNIENYDATQDGLSLAKDDLAAAEAANNEASRERANELKEIIKNLEHLLSIAEKLKEGSDVIYREFDDEYKLLSPFKNFKKLEFDFEFNGEKKKIISSTKRFNFQDAKKFCAAKSTTLEAPDNLKSNNLHLEIKSNFSSLEPATTWGGDHFLNFWSTDISLVLRVRIDGDPCKTEVKDKVAAGCIISSEEFDSVDSPKYALCVK